MEMRNEIRKLARIEEGPYPISPYLIRPSRWKMLSMRLSRPHLSTG